MGYSGPPRTNAGEPMVSPAPPPRRFAGVVTSDPYHGRTCYMGEDGLLHPFAWSMPRPTPRWVAGEFDPKVFANTVAFYDRAAREMPVPAEASRVRYTLRPRRAWWLWATWGVLLVACLLTWWLTQGNG